MNPWFGLFGLSCSLGKELLSHFSHAVLFFLCQSAIDAMRPDGSCRALGKVRSMWP